MPVCPNCGEENPDRARFCLNCAAQLATERGDRDEVRKTVTVVFADVAGSTALGERLDPESHRRVMSRYFTEMRRAVERHGGVVEKFIGDAVMAVFGIPRLHEDDAVRAVRAAAEMRDALAALNEELELRWGVTIATRTGVNTGEVVAGDPSSGQTFVTGDAVNTAARLEQAARPGEILLGATTLRLVRGAVEADAAEPMIAKGKAEPVVAYRLRSVAPGIRGFTRRLDAPLIGRVRERHLLDEAFDRALAERRCRLFAVLGTAGVGKSRLVDEFLDGLSEDATVLRGRCLPYGDGITFWPVAEIVRGAAGIADGDPVDKALAKLRRLVAAEEAGEVVANRVAQTIGLGDEGPVPEETFWAIRKLLEVVARPRPLVVLLEDVHWAEATILDLVEHIAAWSRDAPILLVCTARPELLDQRPEWSDGTVKVTPVLLQPLSSEETDTLIRSLLGTVDVSEELSGRIRAGAEGNPLFVEQMLSALIEEGVLRSSDGHWVVAGDLWSVAVPPTIQALLGARLDRLGPEERSIIERASVVGAEFTFEAVAELAPEGMRARVREHLMALSGKEMIRPESSQPEEVGFRFRHLLVRDAAYDSMPKETRADLHERFADWLEGARAHRLAEYEEIIGHHLETSHRYRGELGPIDDHGRVVAQRAADRLASPGVRAAMRGDVRAACGLLRRSIALLPAGASERGPLSLHLGVALTETGEFSEAERAIASAIESGVASDTDDLVARATLELSVLRLATDPQVRMADVAALAERTVAALAAGDDHRGLADAWERLAILTFWSGRAEAAQAALEQALEHARRTGDRASVDKSLMWLGPILIWGPTPAGEGIRRAEVVLRQGVSKVAEAWLLGAVAVLMAMEGDADGARSTLERFERILEDLGLALLLAEAHPFAEVHLLLGNDQAVVDRLVPGCETLRRMGETGTLSTSAGYLALALYRLGRLEEADRSARLSEKNCASDDVASQTGWRCVRSRLTACRGNVAVGNRLAREAVELAETTDLLDMQGDARMALADVLHISGEHAAAVVREAERAIVLYERKGNAMSAARARTFLEEIGR